MGGQVEVQAHETVDPGRTALTEIDGDTSEGNICDPTGYRKDP